MGGRFCNGFGGRFFGHISDGVFGRFKSNFERNVTADFMVVFTADLTEQMSGKLNFPPTKVLTFVTDFRLVTTGLKRYLLIEISLETNLT